MTTKVIDPQTVFFCHLVAGLLLHAKLWSEKGGHCSRTVSVFKHSGVCLSGALDLNLVICRVQ